MQFHLGTSPVQQGFAPPQQLMHQPAQQVATMPSQSVQQQLKELLRDFGVSGTQHPEYPFWHLRSEPKELWELSGAEAISVSSSGSANSGDLIAR